MSPAQISAERIHVSATWIIGLVIPILAWAWQAQAGDIETTQKVVEANARQISILIEHDKQQQEDIAEIKEDVEEAADAARRNERALIKISAKLEVDSDDDE